MKINPITNPNIVQGYQSSKHVAENTRIGSKRDEVTFSHEAISISKALAEARETIEFRTPEERAHISEITAAVRQGSYRIDSGDVADRILESVFRK